MTDAELLKRARSFHVMPTYPDDGSGGRVLIEWRGPDAKGYDTWAITEGARCYGKARSTDATMRWHYEPSPSNRTPAFLRNHRYTLNEAFDIAAANGWLRPDASLIDPETRYYRDNTKDTP